MIVVDTSALIAILFKEADLVRFVQAILDDDDTVIGAPTLLETLMVAQREYGADSADEVRVLLSVGRVETAAWTAEHAAVAHDAFVRFGRGRHPAQLNFGDCMAYALARTLDAPLLYKGNDFSRTGIRSAL